MKREIIINELMDRAEDMNRWGHGFGCHFEAWTFTSWLSEKGITLEHEEDFHIYFEEGLDLSDLKEMLKAYGLKKAGYSEIPVNYDLRYSVVRGKTFGYEEELISKWNWENADEPFIAELYEKLGCKTSLVKGIREEERLDDLWRNAEGKYERTQVLIVIVPEQVWTYLDFEMETEWDDDEIYEEALRSEVESIYDEGGWIGEKGYEYIMENEDAEDFYKALDLYPGKRLSDFEELYEDGAAKYIIKAHESGLEFATVQDELEFYEKSAEYEFNFTDYALKSASRRNGGRFESDYFDYWRIWYNNEQEIA